MTRVGASGPTLTLLDRLMVRPYLESASAGTGR